MKRLVHIFAVVLLAAFAASTFVHAAATTGMSAQMVMTADADMHNCSGCDEQGGRLVACDQVCIPLVAALPAAEAVEAVPEGGSLGVSFSHRLAGRPGTPEQHPPR